MDDHPRCATCEHWDISRADHTMMRFRQNPPRYVQHFGPSGRGLCTMATDDPQGTATGWVTGYEEPELFTTMDHYCAMHSARHRDASEDPHQMEE